MYSDLFLFGYYFVNNDNDTFLMAFQTDDICGYQELVMIDLVQYDNNLDLILKYCDDNCH